MLRVLLESNTPRQRRRISAAASIAVHTILVAAAIAATASAKTAGPAADKERDRVYILRPPPPPRHPTEGTRPAMPRRTEYERPRPAVPRIPDFVPPSPGNAWVDIDPRRMFAIDTGWSQEGWRIQQPALAHSAGPIGGEPATVATVERPAALLAAPRPRYPDQLRAAGVTGRVVVRLVVDTSGRVEPVSIVVRESSHDSFTEAVRAVLPSLRFRPAEVGGRKVRMLVELPFEFRLND